MGLTKLVETYIGKVETRADKFLSRKIGPYNNISMENKKKLKLGTGLAITAFTPWYIAVPAGLYTYEKIRELIEYEKQKVKPKRKKVAGV